MTTSNARQCADKGIQKYSRTTRTKRTATTAHGPVSTKSKTNDPATRDVVIFEDEAHRLRLLDVSRATEEFNNSLKALSQALKSRTENPKHNPTAQVISAKQCDSRFTGNVRQVGSPLQNRSANKASIFPKEPQCKEHKTQAKIDLSTTGKRAIWALSALFEAKASSSENETSQLDQASSILVNKLLGLGLIDLSIQELCNFGKRTPWYADFRPDSCNKLEHQAQSDPEESLLAVLSIPASAKTTKQATQLALYHLQILKVFSKSGRQLPKSTCAVLDPSNRWCPSGFIVDCLETKALTIEQATQHLYNLSQTMISLGDSISEESSALDESRRLRIKCFALEIRCTWWKMAGHTLDISKELWKPLTRSLTRYLGKNSRLTENTASEVICGFESLRERVELTLIGKNSMVPESVLLLMADIAERAGKTDIALKFYDEAQASTGCQGNSALSSASISCRTATLSLTKLDTTNAETVIAALITTVERLQGQMRGDLPELEALLVDVIKLRRAATQVVQNLLVGTSRKFGSRHDSLRLWCSRAVIAGTRFIFRYLRNLQHSSKASVKEDVMPLKIQEIWKPLLSSIEASVVLLKSRATSDSSEEWEESERSLAEIYQLACLVMEYCDATECSPLRMAIIKLSNILCCRAQVATTPEKADLLRKAINMIQKRPADEWYDGSLSAKYEKLAILLYGQGSIMEAMQSYQLAVIACFDTDATNLLRQMVARGGSDLSWNSSPEKLRLLDRLLSQYAKIIAKQSDKVGVTSSNVIDQTLPRDVKGIVMERFLRQLLCHQISSKMHGFITDFTKALLSLYDPATYPLRRMRTVLTIMSHCIKNPQGIPNELVDQIANEQSYRLLSGEFLGQDSALESYQSYYITCVQLAVAFHLGKPSTELITSTISAWDALLSTIKTGADLGTRIEHTDEFKGWVNTVVDFTHAMGMGQTRLEALKVKERILQFEGAETSTLIILNTLQMCDELMRLGLSDQAVSSLSKVRDSLDALPVPGVGLLRWNLLTAELCLETGKITECSDALVEARKQYMALNASTICSPGVSMESELAHAALLTSRLCTVVGNSDLAILAAKQAVKIILRIWAMLERVDKHGRSTKSETGQEEKYESTMVNLIDKFATMSTGQCECNETDSYSGPKFWPHIDLHVRSLLNMSSIATHNGLFQDAVYFAEQAKKVAKGTGSSSRLIQVDAVLAEIYLRSGRNDAARDLLQTLCHNRSEPLSVSLMVHMNTVLSNGCLMEGNVEQALQYLKDVSIALERNPVPANIISGCLDSNQARQTQFNDRVKLRGSSKASVSKPHRGTGAKNAAKLPSRQPAKSSEDSSHNRPCNLSQMQALTMLDDLNWQKVNILTRANRIREAIELSGKSRQVDSAFASLPVRVAALFGRAKELLLGNSVHSILLDSTISWPSKSLPTKSNVSKSVQKAPVPTTKRPRKTRNEAALQGTFQEAIEAEPFKLLEQVQNILKQDEKAFRSCGSLLHLGSLKELEVKTTLLLSSVNTNFQLEQSKLSSDAHCLSVTGTDRDSAGIHADVELQHWERISQWPTLDHPGGEGEVCLSDVASLCEDILLNLPTNWTVVTMIITEDKKDMLLNRMQHGGKPFTLRLPIERLNEEDEEDDVFNYESCRAELLDIISHANTTTHCTGDRADKAFKKEWWSQRECLDQRLGGLLENIENLWLGGFRGIFAPGTPDHASFAGFSQRLHRILDSHLPSRKKSSKGERVRINDSVVELFLGIGEPDTTDLDDAVADLLAFVVDILQFSGEHNAYDEIDFDMMAVETLDALQSYHSSMEQRKKASSIEHIVLIPSKDLLCFPWESLPCLKNRSVSRLPSLRCLQKRLPRVQGQGGTQTDGVYIDSTLGSYILNPSADLSGTQATFSTALETAQPSYSSILCRAPTESEFTSCLTSSSLFFYFGHGSGAQYVRGRTIRKLTHCATTFLMGCSSVLMHEAGQYEPYGVPWNYMHGGAPAVVGTLWDVTDKDIDRFAMRTFVNWGLLEPCHLEQREPTLKGKARRKKSPQPVTEDPSSIFGGEAARGKVALGEAVAKGRDACVLRYLNGAAPVIYGIPGVFLK